MVTGWPEDPALRRRMAEALLEWVACLETAEPMPEGVDPDLAGDPPDLYSALAALESLRKEVGLQGREFRRLAEAAESRVEAEETSGPDPEEARAAGRREVLVRLLEARDRAARVLETARTVEARIRGGYFGSAARREAYASVLAALSMHRDAIDDALGELDCRELPAQGKAFDPERMRATERAEAHEGPPGTVVEVLKSGWLCGPDLLRPAEVRATPAQPRGEKI